MKANNSLLLWVVNCKTLLLLAVFALEVSTVMAGNEHVFTDTIPITEHKGHILMPVTINHELKYLVFDTGASDIFLWGDKKPFVTKWIDDAVDAKNHTEEVESGLVLAEFGSQCDSLLASYKPLPNDSSLRKALLDTGDGLMGFCPLIRRGQNYFVKVDLQKGIMIVSNDHRWPEQTDGIKVGYKKCESLPTFMVRIGKKHRARLPLDSGAPKFCAFRTSLLNKWEKDDKDLKACKIFDGSIDDIAAANDTAISRKRVRAYKCDFAIESFNVKEALIIDDPLGDGSVGEEIFHKAAISFDPWHRKIIFQPYDM